MASSPKGVLYLSLTRRDSSTPLGMTNKKAAATIGGARLCRADDSKSGEINRALVLDSPAYVEMVGPL